MIRPESNALAQRYDEAAAALSSLFDALRRNGCGVPDRVDGQLIRPALSLSGAAATGAEVGPAEWSAIAAVQLAHEASLLHDDVIDGAAERRGAATVAASRGVAAALVQGDHLLTTAYRLAAASGSIAFVQTFTHAVERTVAGEMMQGRAAGGMLDERAYRNIIGLKSGELIGCAFSAVAFVRGAPSATELYVLGRRIGMLYQMLDDFLDYCPTAATGKPALSDYRQGRWTWPLLELPGVDFGVAEAEVMQLLTGDGGDSTPLRRCLQRLEREADLVRVGLTVHLPGDAAVLELIDRWLARAADAVESMEAAAAAQHAHAVLRAHAQSASSTGAFFRANSKSFSFAARLFPGQFRQRVERLYAFCRLTDDLADGDVEHSVAGRLALLAEWERLARLSHAGTPSGIDLLDSVMRDAAEAGVPFEYTAELIAGMRMDLTEARYPDVQTLRTYSYRVAGVVGQWMTRMCGISDPWVLDRAAALGHAMQLTNILRDVGEDLERGRVYLPGDVMSAYGVTEAALRTAMEGGPLPTTYPALIEELMSRADADYAAALHAVPYLPVWFRPAVRVAASVYRGIHASIREARYDNLRHRARTTGASKLRLAFLALAGPDGALTSADSAPTDAALGLQRRVTMALVLAWLLAAVLGTAVAASPVAGVHGVLPEQPTSLQQRGRPPAVWAQQLEAQHAAQPDHAGIMLDLTRALFFVAVDDAKAVRRGTDVVTRLRHDHTAFATTHAPLLTAYTGAFRMLEAKHGTWPHARLQAVRAGLRDLDSAVTAAPRDAEIRYLRLVNTHYLPGFFGRRDSARQDLAALRRLLDTHDTGLHPELVGVITAFARDAS